MTVTKACSWLLVLRRDPILVVMGKRYSEAW